MRLPSSKNQLSLKEILHKGPYLNPELSYLLPLQISIQGEVFKVITAFELI